MPDPDRAGPATLVEAGGLKLLFDAGRGVPVRLDQIGVRSGDVDAVFVTHFHSDHLNGLSDLWMTGYLKIYFGNREGALRLIGPTGTADIAEGLRDAFAEDVRLRVEGGGTPEAATAIAAEEFDADGVVFDENGVTVTAFAVDHGPVNEPAYGYRVDVGERSVVISGDTTVSANLVGHAKGVDLLVHEVAAIPEPMLAIPAVATVLSIHVTPEQAGEIFAETRPAHAAFTHLVFLGTPDIPRMTPGDIERGARTAWDGPLTVGEDLDRFTVGEEVTVERWDPETGGY